ncbi:vacuolar-sorting protein SNF8 [Meredithblackwellia eburnea MCA 4105]
MRRNAGMSSLQRHIDQTSSYGQLSSDLLETQMAILNANMSTFQTTLSNFSTRHRAKIASSPQFRQHFSQLCAELGVDPLGGGTKGLWDKIGVGDWYYALGVQVVDVCLQARERGGGLVALDEVLHRVMQLRSGGGKGALKPSASGQLQPQQTEISESDIKRAIEALEPLGCGYALLVVGGKKVVQCYPGGLDRDSLVVVEAAGSTGRGAVTQDEILQFTRKGGAVDGWNLDRIDRAIEKAIMDDGMVWVDEQSGGGGVVAGKEYWVPALFDFELQ